MIYRREIDGLRAIAVVAVMLFHTQYTYFSHGFIGVDIFFVISGYLITGLIVSDIEEKKFSVSSFYLKRAKRLLPALLLVILACVPFAWFWMFSDQYKDFSQSIIASSTFGSNILFWLESQNYFHSPLSYKPLLHTWSLAVEGQFYFIYPITLLLLLHYGKSITVLGISLLTFSFFCYQHFFIYNPLTQHYMLHARVWLFGVGALTYFARQKWQSGQLRHSGYLAAVGLSILMLTMLSFNQRHEFLMLLSGLPWPYISALAVVVVMLFSDASNKVGQLLSNQLIASIGVISYSLYLWHYPIFVFARIRLLTVPMGMYVLLGFIAVLLSYISWRFVEVPFRKSARISSKSFLVSCVLTIILVVLLGAYGVKNEGYVVGMSEVDNSFMPNDGLSAYCGLENRAQECQSREEPEILVWGDSFAMHSVGTILGSNPDVAMVQFTLSACSPLASKRRVLANEPYNKSLTESECSKLNKLVLASIAELPSLRYVVISSRLSNYFKGRKYLKLSEEGRANYYEGVAGRYRALLNEVRNKGVIPIVISEPRSPPEEAVYCAAHSIKFESDGYSCKFFTPEMSEAQMKANQLLKSVSTDYKVVWLDNYICSSAKCITMDGRTTLYNYTGHLSNKGSLVVGAKLGVYQQIKAVKLQ
jgi:peptidoglycan/LPS O-acetylase OafA/YrhL